MKLIDYINETGISKTLLAKRAGIGTPTLYRLLNGKEVSLQILKKISVATKGKCTVQDMMPASLKALLDPPRAQKALKSHPLDITA